MRRLVLLRHGKSDWSGQDADRDRPLARRGRRQAPEAGRWLASSGIGLDLAVVSPATRARETWQLAAAELPAPPPVRVEEAAYTFSGEHLRAIVHGLPEDREAVVVVGHNPALEELLFSLTGEWHELPTSCLAVLHWDGTWAAPAAVALEAHGRPPS